MARPKKTSSTPEATAGVDSFRQTYLDPLPTRVDLLQTIVLALLNRIRRMDAETVRQVSVFVRVLAARSAYWDSTRSTPQDGVEATREWHEYHDLLAEIALGKKTKMTHCPESVIEHRRLLDLYLGQHGDFSTCQNLLTTREWIAKHEDTILELLEPIPCFCSYGDALMPATLSRPLKQALCGNLTPGRFRDILLALLHCTTPTQIQKICKCPTSFMNDEFRHLEDVVTFPS